jgi:ribosomal protein L32/predicted GIY-YIG superfamily endonuclease
MGEEAVTSVYQYYDAHGHILYVGVTARGIRRAHEHAETKEWWPLCTGCVIEHFLTRDEALAREKSLIQRHVPPYNTVHNAYRAEARGAYEEIRAKSTPPIGNSRTTRQTSESRKKQARAWYRLSAEEKVLAPCITCGERPGLHGPQCAACKPNKVLKVSGTPA